MALRGTMKLYYSTVDGKTFNLQFTNADLEAAPSDIKLAAAMIADSVITGQGDNDLEFMQATGMVESILAEAD